MIASVSTLPRSSGATNPSRATNFSMSASHAPYVHEVPLKGGRCSHRWTQEVSAAACALAAFEVAVRGRCAALARFQPVVVHREAHRAAGLTPFESRRGENLVETLGF